MAARQFYYAESTAESTTTLASYQDKTTLTFTPDASSTYYLLGSALVEGSTTTTAVNVKMAKTTATAADYQTAAVRVNNTADYYAQAFAGVYASGASPG